MSAEYEKKFLDFFVDVNDDPFYGNRRRMVNALGEDYYSNKLNFPKVIQMLSNKESKNVIFTSWLEHGVKHITKILNDNDLRYGIIEGSVGAAERANIVKDFNSGKINNLIITTAGMAGIDLVGVTNIIVIDPVWNDANLQQIIGRGVRFRSHMHLPENKRVVNVYLLQLVERAIFEKTMDISKSRSGDLILYKFIAKKESENKDVLKMLKKISVV
jgi:superfamily II DNA/RNA helicase